MNTASKAIAFGASAGGIQAISRLLPTLAGAAESAAIIVLHVHPHSRVSVQDIYRPVVGLHFAEAEEKEPLLAGRVYFAPPGYHLLVERDRTISLSVDEPCNWSRPSIDITFSCLAQVYKNQATAILLTGANRDGARGCRAVQQAGGRVVVQDPREAEVNTMPCAALELCSPDYVGTLDESAALLRTWIVERQL